MQEFDLIRRYFASLSIQTDFVQLGQGDDSALFAPREGHSCAVSTDTLVSGVHFLPTLAPEKLAHRALAVNLSDLAAMGADARAFTLALTLPSVEEAWLERFSEGLTQCAQRYDVSLMGGDTTRGPLSLTLTVFGELPQGEGLKRAGAQEGDDLWVSGALGAAWCGLQLCTQPPAWLVLDESAMAQALRAFDLPIPRLAVGKVLRQLGATSALDVSDGLAGDAQHLAQASQKTLRIDLDALPVFSPLMLAAPDKATALQIALCGGDDYELLFTVPKQHRIKVADLAKASGVSLVRIGEVLPRAECSLVYVAKDSQLIVNTELEMLSGFDHFADS